MYEKLKSRICLTMYMLNSIYSHPELQCYAKNDENRLQSYNDNRRELPSMTSMWLPAYSNFDVNSCEDLNTAVRFLAKSRSTRGEDSRGLGVITLGYMWYDMDRSLFIDIAAAQDMLSFGNTHHRKAVASESLNVRVVRILNANGMTVYSNRAVAIEKDTKETGYYISGSRSFFVLRDLDIKAPVVTARTVEWDNVATKLDILRKSKHLEIAYFYLYPILETCNLSVYPTFRPHNGSCLVSNKKCGGDACKSMFRRLVARFYESNHVRNLFPFTRATFSQLDIYTTYFRADILVPRNIPRTFVVLGDTITAKAISLPKRTAYDFDFDLVDQVSLEESLAEVLDSFHEELATCRADVAYEFILSVYRYPRTIPPSKYFPTIIAIDKTYSIINDPYVVRHYPHHIERILSLEDEKKEEKKRSGERR